MSPSAARALRALPRTPCPAGRVRDAERVGTPSPALLLKEAGFEAIGTSSAALAASLGRLDGRHAVSRDEHLAHAALLGHVTGLPVNGDVEDGYGDTPAEVAATVEAAIDAGLAGIGIEDTSGDPAAPIRPFDDAVARVAAAARVAAKGRDRPDGADGHKLHPDGTLPTWTTPSAAFTAFAEAGADVLYAPFPATMADLVAIVRAVAPKPVNVVVGTMEGPVPVAELRAAGVARISLGAALYGRVMADLLARRRTARGRRHGVGVRGPRLPRDHGGDRRRALSQPAPMAAARASIAAPDPAPASPGPGRAASTRRGPPRGSAASGPTVAATPSRIRCSGSRRRRGRPPTRRP